MSRLPDPKATIAGHPRTIAGLVAAVAAFPLTPYAWGVGTRAVVAWDLGASLLVLLFTILFAQGHPDGMRRNAERQEEGEWTMFCITLAGVAFSFFALTQELPNVKSLSPAARNLHVALVAATLVLSWLVTHLLFAARYAHEYYSASSDAAKIDAGLVFPGMSGGMDGPDYWDFVYFSIVLAMTFQVSDVQITSRKLRRLATVHGLIAFLFNTVVVALTVNLAAGLMG